MRYNIVKDGQIVGEADFATPQRINITLKDGVKFIDIKGLHVKCEVKGEL